MTTENAAGEKRTTLKMKNKTCAYGACTKKEELPVTVKYNGQHPAFCHPLHAALWLTEQYRLQVRTTAPLSDLQRIIAAQDELVEVNI